MRHLKYFNESKEDKLYKEIDFVKFGKELKKERENFTEKEINEIYNIIPRYYVLKNIDQVHHISRETMKKVKINKFIIEDTKSPYHKSLKLICHKFIDEWYLISHYRDSEHNSTQHYILCDEFKGFVQYFKDFVEMNELYNK